MRKIIDLKRLLDLEKDERTKSAIEVLVEFDKIITSIQNDSMELISASMAIESLTLGLISRALQVPCHEPSEGVPYWWMQLEMSCGSVLTLKVVDLNNLNLEA